MIRVNLQERLYLEKRFGSRVTFNLTERELYSYDIAALPGLIKPLIGDTTPEAVIQPQSEQELVDLARFSSSYLGDEFPDPNPEVQKQWAVFEAMIALMTPQGFAELMSTMWPELISAMPFGMGSMMRLMGKIPGVLNLMKPMFPILFPKLLPLMMPRVMRVMLERLKERIPMPELMPRVMDNLMPHMIGEVVPLVAQPMIDYLREKK
jgi:hypothetical protein